MPETPAPAGRSIRSFVKRGGRTTPAQARALELLWPAFGIDSGQAPLDLMQCFPRNAPRVLEIGFGDGEALIARAQAEPHTDFLGIEVHPPGVGHCLLLAEAASLCNLKVISQDAVEVLSVRLAPLSLTEVVIWFPDPWPKKRHHKRRLLQPEFASLIASRLVTGGRLRFASDWQPYAAHALELLNSHPQFVNVDAAKGFVARPDLRALTKFERRGMRLGHEVHDLEFIRR
jgi:tRNA (guanine-N7-)-methyltransferase